MDGIERTGLGAIAAAQASERAATFGCEEAIGETAALQAFELDFGGGIDFSALATNHCDAGFFFFGYPS